MNLNVNSIGFGAKVPASRINIVKNDPYLEELMSQKGSEIKKLADQLGRNVTLSRVSGVFNGAKGPQSVDAVYINSGVQTSRFDLTKAKNGDELIKAIGSNLRLNA